MRELFKGVTSYSQYLVLRNSTTGVGLTGKAHTDVTGSYTRNRAARTAITMASLASASAAFSSGGFVEVDATNCPGLYRFDIPDAAFATGVDKVVVSVKVTGALEEHLEFQLIDWNKQVAAIPNAAAGAASGLITAGGTGNMLPNGAIATTAFAAGAIDAAAIATDAIGSAELAASAAAKIAAAVWDELRSAHTTAGTFGRSAQVIRDGTAQAGAGGTITLDAGASAVDNFYNASLIQIVSGTGAGQSRFISGYTGATKVAAVQGNWLTTPDNTSVFVIYPFGTIASIGTVTGNVLGSVASVAAGGITAASFAAGAIDANAIATDAIGGAELASTAADEIASAVWDRPRTSNTAPGTFGRSNQISRDGTAQAGAAGSITLDASASATDGFYTGQVCYLQAGTGAGQLRTITGYTGATKVATVSPNWATNPDNTTVFVLLPGETVLPLTSTQTAAAVWDEARSGHSTAGTFGQGVASVQGNVTGSVGSVTAAVTVGTNSDKTGYSLTAVESNVLHSGTAQAGSGSTITLAAGASATNDLYKGLLVKIVSGSGAGQARGIIGYVGSTKVATIDRAWATTPDNSSVYALEAADSVALDPNLNVTISAISSSALVDIKNQAVAALATDTYAEPSGVPAATASLKDKIGWLMALARNKITQTATTKTVRNDGDTATVGTATVSDDGTTFTHGKFT